MREDHVMQMLQEPLLGRPKLSKAIQPCQQLDKGSRSSRTASPFQSFLQTHGGRHAKVFFDLGTPYGTGSVLFDRLFPMTGTFQFVPWTVLSDMPLELLERMLSESEVFHFSKTGSATLPPDHSTKESSGFGA